ncbi:hypothetical protein [Halocatena halophila]|uniref:hypothetical protein n=1 Tax=Halocatena halophila TaxID=2814576 RepID=UPI002ED1CC40
MRIQQSPMDRLRDVPFDVLVAGVGLLMGIVLLPLQLVLTDVFARTLPIATGCAAGLYLLSVSVDRNTAIPRLTRTAVRLLPSVIVIGMAMLVLIAGVQGERSLAWYLCCSAVGTAILVLIIFADEEDISPTLWLFLIIVFGMIVRLVALYTTPGYIGIDVWTHMAHWAQDIHAARSLQPISGQKYYASPLYHLLVVGSSLLLDVSIKSALYLVIGVSMPLSVVFVYATASSFVTQRWAVFAGALYSMSGAVIEWGLHLIPTSLGLVFFLGVFYSLERMLKVDYTPRDFFLVVFFSISVILTHQVSSFIMLVLTGGAVLASLVISSGILTSTRTRWRMAHTAETVNLTGLLVFDLGLITFMWSLTPYQGATFLTTIGTYFSETLITAGLGQTADAGGLSPTVVPTQTTMEFIVEYLDVAGFLLVFCLTIVGSLWVLQQQNRSQAAFTPVFSVGIMSVFVFGFPLFGIRTFVPGRWFAFMLAPMAVVAVIGLAHLSATTSPRIAGTVFLVVILCFPTTSMLASDSTIDSPPFENTQARYSFTHAELAAIEAIDRYAKNKSRNWVTDHPYTVVVNRTLAHNMESATISTQSGTVVGYARSTRNVSGTTTTVVRPAETRIYRSYQRRGAAYFGLFHQNASMAHTPRVSREVICPRDADVIYANDAVQICTVPTR